MSGSAMARRSRWLSRHLRHSPHRIGLDLEPGGWVSVEELLAASATHGMPMSRAQLDEVVAGSDKQRFDFSQDGSRIRANQGHSVAVDLQLEHREPPEVLFHGTGAKAVDSILATGLDRRRRHHVHLSVDEVTALRVGARHGDPVVLRVDAAAMSVDGFEFFVSANGVWLCEAVPPSYLTVVG
jgi:putative RNA 2'-phosphotransferase